jgi:hypothetical protein
VPSRCLTRDLDAFEEVIRGLPAHRRIWVADAAEFVLGSLEEVRVDGPYAQTQRLDVAFQFTVVVDPVPRDVYRHRGAYAGETVHLRRIGQLLERVAGYSRLREDSEARVCVAVAPRRGLHPLGAQSFFHARYVYPVNQKGSWPGHRRCVRPCSSELYPPSGMSSTWATSMRRENLS